MSFEPSIITPITAEFVHGAADFEYTCRGLLPHRPSPASRAQLGGPVDPKVFSDPSGVRLRIDTESTCVELVTWPQKYLVADGPVSVPPVYEIWCQGELLAQVECQGGTVTTENPVTGEIKREDIGPGAVVLPELPVGPKTVEIWLPYQEPTELIEIRSDAEVAPTVNCEKALRWVHHGSSISHGYDAVGASHAWPAVAARKSADQCFPVELTNLGFSGNAMLDPFTARTIAELTADVITLKLGISINVVNGDTHNLRSLRPALHGFMDIIRAGQHAHTPVLIISPLWCGIQEQTPGPVEPYNQRLPDGTLRRYFRAAGDPERVRDGRLTLRILREELAQFCEVRAEKDRDLRFLNGLELYTADDAVTHSLADSLHPSHDAHQLIGVRFTPHLLNTAPNSHACGGVAASAENPVD